MIPYLKELGVTSLLLMPVYEFEEFPPEQDRREKTRIRCSGNRWSIRTRFPKKKNPEGTEKLLGLYRRPVFCPQGLLQFFRLPLRGIRRNDGRPS